MKRKLPNCCFAIFRIQNIALVVIPCLGYFDRVFFEKVTCAGIEYTSTQPINPVGWRSLQLDMLESLLIHQFQKIAIADRQAKIEPDPGTTTHQSMFELTPTQFSTILPLLADFPQKVLPYAVLEGINPGRVWMNQRENPTIVLIWSTVGYYCLAGEPQNGELSNIQRVLTEILIPASLTTGGNCLILIPSTEAWKAYLPLLLPDREVIELYRRPFAFDPVKFAALGDWRARLPPGLRMQPVDEILAAQLDILASWTSVEDFLSNGMGFALVDGNEVASACTSVFASHERVEIDVHTTEVYRRRGLAKLAVAALIETCLRQGKQPNWECFWDNEPSIALAEKLGFTPLPDYPVYFWEEPATSA